MFDFKNFVLKKCSLLNDNESSRLHNSRTIKSCSFIFCIVLDELHSLQKRCLSIQNFYFKIARLFGNVRIYPKNIEEPANFVLFLTDYSACSKDIGNTHLLRNFCYFLWHKKTKTVWIPKPWFLMLDPFLYIFECFFFFFNGFFFIFQFYFNKKTAKPLFKKSEPNFLNRKRK